MNNEEYGVKLSVDLTEFKAKMQEAVQITQEFSQKVRENIDINPEIDTKSMDNMGNAMNELKNSMANQLKEMLSGLDKNKIALIIGLGYAIKNVADRFRNARETADRFKMTISKIGTGIKSLGAGIKTLGKNITSKLVQGTNKGVSSLKKYALHLFGLQALWRGASKAISAYMSYDSELSKNISNTWAGLGSFVAPVIEYLVSLFQKLLAYANAVMKVFTGINFVARANAKAMKGVAGATANANKQLAGFDELQNINQNTGGGGGGSTPQIEIPDIDTSSLENYMSHLKDLFKNGEYFQMGYEIGKSITDALDKIPWEEIQLKAGQIGKGLAEFLNGAIAGIDWTVIGNTIAQGINTIIDFAYNFVTTFDWKKFGESIAIALNTAVENINWDELSKTLSTGINGAINTLYTFVTNFNWKKFGNKIGKSLKQAIKDIDWSKLGQTFTESIVGVFDFSSAFTESLNGIDIANSIEEYIRNIDFGKIASSISEFLGSLAGLIVLTLGTLIADTFDGIGQYFGKEIEDCGGDIVEGILKGIVDAITGLGTWIGDNILTPFIDGFKNAFQIHSPSQVMVDLGGDIVAGLIKALKEIPKKALEEFNKFKTTVVNTMTDIKNKASNKATDIVNGIKEKFTKIPDWFKNTFTKAWDNVKNVFSSGGKIFDGIKEGIDKTFKTIVNKLIDGINTVITKPFNKINSMLNDIRSADILGVKPFQGLWGRNPISVPKIPKLRVGTDEVLSEGLAYLHAGEKVVPADVAKGGYTGSDNEETNKILRELLVTLTEKEFSASISSEDVGKASVNYINKRKRITGEELF